MTNWHAELRQKRRAVILDAAAKIFASKGYQRATIQDVATEAGIAPGTIYLYFADKRALLTSIADQLVALIPTEVPLQESPDEEREFIRTLLAERLAVIQAYRPFFRVLVAEMWTDDTLRTYYLDQVLAPVLNAIEVFLQQALDAGKVRPLNPQIAARAMVGAIFMLAATTDMPAGDYLQSPNNETLVRELTDFFFYGVRALDLELPA